MLQLRKRGAGAAGGFVALPIDQLLTSSTAPVPTAVKCWQRCLTATLARTLIQHNLAGLFQGHALLLWFSPSAPAPRRLTTEAVTLTLGITAEMGCVDICIRPRPRAAGPVPGARPGGAWPAGWAFVAGNRTPGVGLCTFTPVPHDLGIKL